LLFSFISQAKHSSTKIGTICQGPSEKHFLSYLAKYPANFDVPLMLKPNFLVDWISRKLADLPGCLHLKAFNLTKKGSKSDGSIKGLEVFLSTSKVSRELGTHMTRLVKKVKTYIDNDFFPPVPRNLASPAKRAYKQLKKFPLLYLEMSRWNHFSFCNTSR